MSQSGNTRRTSSEKQRGRLQREPTSSGYRVATFADVLKRHGLVMALLAFLCLAVPGSWALIEASTARFVDHPTPYLLGIVGLILFFAYWCFRHAYTVARQVPWIIYLLFISVVEEFTFRLALPSFLSAATSLTVAHVLSNILFASIHYVTLRWRLVNCLVTFMGGMGLSHLMAQGDLVLVILVHWLGTFINTPRPPSAQSDGAG